MLNARTLLGLALLLPALGAVDPAKDRIKRFNTASASPVMTERIEAIRELRVADDPLIIEKIFAKVFQDPDFRVAEEGARFLVRTGTPEALDWMKANGQVHSDPRVRYYTLRTLEALPEPPSAAQIAPYVKDEHWVIRLQASSALARSQDEAAVPLLRSMLNDKMDPVRGSAILGLSDHKAAQYLPEIRKALSDKDWRVRSSALEAVETLKDYEAIPLLRQVHEKETEIRLLDDIEQTLFRMGASLKLEIEEKKREDERQARLLGGEDSWVETHRREEAVDYGPKLKDLKTLSRRIAYLFDCSKSMEDALHEHPDPPAPSKPKHGKGPGYDVGDGKDPGPKERSDAEVMGYDRQVKLEKERGESFPQTKLGFCQREICRAIRQLKPETSFNVIGFRGSGKQMPWQKAYTRATPEMIQKAAHFVKGQGADGQTAAYDAIVLAIGFQEHDLFGQAASWDPKLWPDTVILFSDGRPTEGLVMQEVEFEASIRRLYRICRTRIHTVGVGRGDLHLLEQIAHITGGRFVQIADIE